MTTTTSRSDAPRLALSELADALFEAVPHGLVVTDEGGVIQWADRWFGELAAKDPDQVRGLRLSRCLVGTAPVLRSLRGRKKAEGVVRLKRKGAPDLELHAQAARGGPRSSAAVVWVLDDKTAPTPARDPAAADSPPLPSKRPSSGPPQASELHLEALRLLHELASGSSDEFVG